MPRKPASLVTFLTSRPALAGGGSLGSSPGTAAPHALRGPDDASRALRRLVETAQPPPVLADPADLSHPERPARPRRDVSLDLLRGVAMVILLVNHTKLDSWLRAGTSSVLSAAEMLVAISGVVVGMVYGRRWLLNGARAATVELLLRARRLYVASVVVVALVGVLSAVPWLATDAVIVSPSAPETAYHYDLSLRTVLAVVTLEAGPWQFNVLGLFIAMLPLAPVVLHGLARGRWVTVLAMSWLLYAAGRAWPVDVLPAQSERPFPLLVWQLLFVHGMALGWHRDRVARAVRASRGVIPGAIVAVALAAAYLQLHDVIADPLGLGALLADTPADWSRWLKEHFRKSTLDPVRLATMMSLTAALYLAIRRWERPVERALGWFLLPLGRASFYVFIVHVFACLAIASAVRAAGGGIGGGAQLLVQLGYLAALWALVRHRVLFRWIPR